MTDRIRTLQVQLSRDTRTDDAETVINAIRMIKGVEHVYPGEVVGLEAHMERAAALQDFAAMQMELLLLAMLPNQPAYEQVRKILTDSRRARSGTS